MTRYKNDRQLTLELLAIRAFQVLIAEGQTTPQPDLLALLNKEKTEINIPPDREAKINCRAIRILNTIVRPFEEAEASVAKFGLVLFYVLRELVDQGRFAIDDGSALDKFCDLLLSDDGSLVELANIRKVDSSAQKASRKMMEVLRKELGL